MAEEKEEKIKAQYANIAYGTIPTQDLIDRYKSGWFAMCFEEAGEKKMGWFKYAPRAVLPLDEFKIPHGSAKFIRSHKFKITVDQDFEGVMRGCAALSDKPGRSGTWINEEIIQSYVALHKTGHAHSVEVRDAEGRLVGGLYGVSIGGAFFGESMFSTAEGASKVALTELVQILKEAGYRLLDTQEVTSLTRQFGARTIPLEDYEHALSIALKVEPDPNQHFLQAAGKCEERRALTRQRTFDLRP